jgi:diguanylate cyclase (GGDEF)-like protein
MFLLCDGEYVDSDVKVSKSVDRALMFDSLTGLKSYSVLLEDIQFSQTVTIIIVDIDDFKKINNLYGFEIGNEVLYEFAQLLDAYNSDHDYNLYRISSAEFALLDVSGVIDSQKHSEDVEELIEIISENMIYLPSIDISLHIDVTLAIASSDENVMAKAYMALEVAKKRKQRCQFYTPQIDTSQHNKRVLNIRKDIHEALINSKFIPVFQAIVDKDEKVIKYECLIRLKESDGSVIVPSEFLDVAVETNQFLDIQMDVMRKIFEYMHDKNIDFSINISMDDVSKKDFKQFLKDMLSRYDIAHRVVFEILEDSKSDDYDSFIKFVSEFRSLGVRIAIDDFGTGYSNFTYIFDIEPDYVKIDGSLIKNVDCDLRSQVFIKAIISFSQRLGMKIIAEYVHSNDVFNTLKNLGVDEFQGFYFAKPVERIST